MFPSSVPHITELLQVQDPLPAFWLRGDRGHRPLQPMLRSSAKRPGPCRAVHPLLMLDLHSSKSRSLLSLALRASAATPTPARSAPRPHPPQLQQLLPMTMEYSYEGDGDYVGSVILKPSRPSGLFCLRSSATMTQ
jgi:hypothetical protein